MMFKQKSPRARSLTMAECYAKPVLFMEWDKMPKSAQEEFAKNGPIPCEGGGVPGFWCEQCRFGKIYEPERLDD